MVPKPTIWEAEPHTLAKHAILQGYLEAWFPILARYQGRISYFDGFAGPGRYSKGEDGSPIVALKVALHHRAQLKCELVFTFVEERKDRAAHLRDVELPSLSLPANFKTEVEEGEFAPVLEQGLNYLDANGFKIAPTFAFVDPFGISGLPFSLIERLLQRRSCEVLITFMTSTVNRFVTELPSHVNELIGDPTAADKIARSSDRVGTARALYQSSLGRVAKFVRFFQLRDTSNHPIYDLFFATNDPLGHTKMKEAMWKVDASGAYSFADSTNPDQTTLFSPSPGSDLLPALCERFAGRKLDVREVYRHTEDETPYLEKHAREALGLLEKAGAPLPCRIEVDELKADGKKRKRGTFPDGTIVRFVGQAGGPT